MAWLARSRLGMNSTRSVAAPLVAPRAAAKSGIGEDLRFFSLQYGLSGQKVKLDPHACSRRPERGNNPLDPSDPRAPRVPRGDRERSHRPSRYRPPERPSWESVPCGWGSYVTDDGRDATMPSRWSPGCG